MGQSAGLAFRSLPAGPGRSSSSNTACGDAPALGGTMVPCWRRASKWSSAATKRAWPMCESGTNSRVKKFKGLKNAANSSGRVKREVVMFQFSSVWVIAGLAVLAVLFLMILAARMYRKAGPHEALIVYGFRGTRIIKGGGTIIFPMVEQCKELSLELMSFDVAPQQSLYTNQGVAVTVEAVAQLQVKSDPLSIRTP